MIWGQSLRSTVYTHIWVLLKLPWSRLTLPLTRQNKKDNDELFKNVLKRFYKFTLKCASLGPNRFKIQCEGSHSFKSLLTIQERKWQRCCLLVSRWRLSLLEHCYRQAPCVQANVSDLTLCLIGSKCPCLKHVCPFWKVLNCQTLPNMLLHCPL